MRTDEIYAGLTSIFHDVFSDEAIVLSPTTTADDIEGWDSGRMIELIIAAEARFGVRFTTREVDGMARVADFVETIARKTTGS
ncbi:MAG TPA: acyl carrier protein [Methylobacterium sp.]|jgi:acyl carrier protein